MSTTQQASASDALSGTDTPTTRVVRELVMTPAASELLTGLAQATGTTEGDVLRLALGMFKVAVDSRKEGKHVGIATSPEALDIEFVGFLK
ncbi:MAG TPA: hypothetical protein VFF52_06995 [Isosphaeraceae bacterium]|nr:hypothetical protein [Isosphaeraceae bacterium]